ncbi:MAG: ribosome-associated translation inhibitor RaiA [Pseudomonadota bacterium]|jgi:putative sigma-54 modulation protein
MKISITTKNFDITPAIKNHVEHALQPLKKHFHPLPTPVHVTLSVEKFHQIAKAHVHLPNKKDIEASYSSKDMYESIDLLAKNLDEQALKHKEEMKSRGHGNGHYTS